MRPGCFHIALLRVSPVRRHLRVQELCNVSIRPTTTKNHLRGHQGIRCGVTPASSLLAVTSVYRAVEDRRFTILTLNFSTLQGSFSTCTLNPFCRRECSSSPKFIPGPTAQLVWALCIEYAYVASALDSVLASCFSWPPLSFAIPTLSQPCIPHLRSYMQLPHAARCPFSIHSTVSWQGSAPVSRLLLRERVWNTAAEISRGPPSWILKSNT